VVAFGPVEGVQRVVWAGRHKSGQRGASLVEFAILAPLLIMLLFGIVEFAWIFAQNLDVRHGAREGARLAAVNFPAGVNNGDPRTDGNRAALIAETCGRMDLATGATVEVESSGAVGDAAAVTVASAADTLTGLMDWVIPASLTLTSTVEIRMEQPATWTNTPGTPISCPP
jgi:Flp pilus assembly protein TadG